MFHFLVRGTINKTSSTISRTMTTHTIAADPIAIPNFQVWREIAMPTSTYPACVLANNVAAVPSFRAWRDITMPSSNYTVRALAANGAGGLAATSLAQNRNFSLQGAIPPAPKEEERSPITQACSKLPENILLATYLYYKLRAEQVPPGWSNDPVHLEKALSIPVEDCGAQFKVSMPILVFVDHNDVITWYLFEAGAKYYFYSRSCSVYHIKGSGKLVDVLSEIAEVGVKGMMTSVVGRVHGDDLECGSLMVAS